MATGVPSEELSSSLVAAAFLARARSMWPRSRVGSMMLRTRDLSCLVSGGKARLAVGKPCDLCPQAREDLPSWSCDKRANIPGNDLLVL